jgi:polyvinyl alcohol dehydrogenase (cytochrome)
MSRRKIVGALGAIALVSTFVIPVMPAQAKPGCAPADHKGGEWRSFSGSYDGHRNQRAEKTIGIQEAASLQPVWTFSANAETGVGTNEITGYPVVADGCIFVGSSTGQQTAGYAFALNADTGELVWKTEFPHGIYGSMSIEDGKVFAFVSQHGEGEKEGVGPYVVAMDQDTGEVLWKTVADTQPGADAVSSPVYYKDTIWVGISGTAAEVEGEEDRFEFQGNYVFIDADTGKLLERTYTIPKKKWKKGFAGGAIWSTLSIDVETGYGYAGTGNPFNYDSEHKNTNAVLKIDADPDRPTFGDIVGSYKGDVEEYFPQVGENFSCDPNDPVGAFFAGIECGRLDVDFGATANIFEIEGRTVVGVGQKSGVYHVMDAKTMKPVWKAVIGVPSPVGGIVGSTAFDGENIYGPHTVGGYMWSLDGAGTQRWVSPFADAIHWGPPATYANGILYTVDTKGNLVGMDAATGAQILNYPMLTETAPDSPASWGAAIVARNTVYATVGIGITSAGLNSVPGGYVIAFQPSL